MCFKVETMGSILEYRGGELSETPIGGNVANTIARGNVVGFGTFSGLCDGEVPSVSSQEPRVGLQLMFSKEGSKEITFISGEITRVHRT